ncbi:MAG: hypothetical protein Q8O58_12275 [Gallionella sp.]|nr:hypothetical protein [Gallionella sp.]
MNGTFLQPISILVIEDDPGDFGLIRAHIRMPGLVPSGNREPVIWAKTLAEGITAAQCGEEADNRHFPHSTSFHAGYLLRANGNFLLSEQQNRGKP